MSLMRLGLQTTHRGKQDQPQYIHRKINLDYTISAATTFAEDATPAAGGGKEVQVRVLERNVDGEGSGKEVVVYEGAEVDQGGSFLFPGILQPLAGAIMVDDLAVKLLYAAINGQKTPIIEADGLRDEGKRLKKELECDRK